jgi:5-methylcytosine-specific restriction enzyme subunit McrC
MGSLTLFEFDRLVEGKLNEHNSVSKDVFTWLWNKALKNQESDENPIPGLKVTQSKNRRAIQVMNYVGVICAPCGFQIEVLPKIGRNASSTGADDDASQDIGKNRKLLIKMLKFLPDFGCKPTANANLLAERMPLMEIFIQQFLEAVGSVVKRGIRSDYVVRRDNLFALRGRLLVAQQISKNLIRRDRFFTEHDEFSQDRAENRLIHSALCRVLTFCREDQNQRLARELNFVFADVPLSVDVDLDFQRVRLDRGMSYYGPALDWAKLILRDFSPTSVIGKNQALSLLFPMEAVFEAYVTKRLANHLRDDFVLQPQAKEKYLVKHKVNQKLFYMKPDLLVKCKCQQKTLLILDTKWKLLSSSSPPNTYNLSESDFYQMYAYGHHYFDNNDVSRNIVLIYPKTPEFMEPLAVFSFSHPQNMRLWVLPFCIDNDRLILPTPSPTPADPDSKFPRELFDVNEMNEACSPELCL